MFSICIPQNQLYDSSALVTEAEARQLQIITLGGASGSRKQALSSQRQMSNYHISPTVFQRVHQPKHSTLSPRKQSTGILNVSHEKKQFAERSHSKNNSLAARLQIRIQQRNSQTTPNKLVHKAQRTSQQDIEGSNDRNQSRRQTRIVGPAVEMGEVRKKLSFTQGTFLASVHPNTEQRVPVAERPHPRRPDIQKFHTQATTIQHPSLEKVVHHQPLAPQTYYTVTTHNLPQQPYFILPAQPAGAKQYILPQRTISVPNTTIHQIHSKNNSTAIVNNSHIHTVHPVQSPNVSGIFHNQSEPYFRQLQQVVSGKHLVINQTVKPEASRPMTKVESIEKTVVLKPKPQDMLHINYINKNATAPKSRYALHLSPTHRTQSNMQNRLEPASPKQTKVAQAFNIQNSETVSQVQSRLIQRPKDDIEQNDSPELAETIKRFGDLKPSRFKCAESRHIQMNTSSEQRSMRIEQSIIEDFSVMRNFTILKVLKPDQGKPGNTAHYQNLLVVEKNIGYVLSLKKVDRQHLNLISNEMTVSRLLMSKEVSSGSLLKYYECQFCEGPDYLILRQFYSTTLHHIKNQVTEQLLPCYILPLVEAFIGLAERGVRYNNFSLKNVAIISCISPAPKTSVNSYPIKLMDFENCTVLTNPKEVRLLNQHYKSIIKESVKSILLIENESVYYSKREYKVASPKTQSLLQFLKDPASKLQDAASHPYFK